MCSLTQTLCSNEQWSYHHETNILIMPYLLDSLLLCSQTDSALSIHPLCCLVTLPTIHMPWSLVHLTNFLQFIVVLLVPPMSFHRQFLFHSLCQPPPHNLFRGCQTMSQFASKHNLLRGLCKGQTPKLHNKAIC